MRETQEESCRSQSTGKLQEERKRRQVRRPGGSVTAAFKRSWLAQRVRTHDRGIRRLVKVRGGGFATSRRSGRGSGTGALSRHFACGGFRSTSRLDRLWLQGEAVSQGEEQRKKRTNLVKLVPARAELLARLHMARQTAVRADPTLHLDRLDALDALHRD